MIVLAELTSIHKSAERQVGDCYLTCGERMQRLCGKIYLTLFEEDLRQESKTEKGLERYGRGASGCGSEGGKRILGPAEQGGEETSPMRGGS